MICLPGGGNQHTCLESGDSTGPWIGVPIRLPTSRLWTYDHSAAGIEGMAIKESSTTAGLQHSGKCLAASGTRRTLPAATLCRLWSVRQVLPMRPVDARSRPGLARRAVRQRAGCCNRGPRLPMMTQREPRGNQGSPLARKRFQMEFTTSDRGHHQLQIAPRGMAARRSPPTQKRPKTHPKTELRHTRLGRLTKGGPGHAHRREPARTRVQQASAPSITGTAPQTSPRQAALQDGRHVRWLGGTAMASASGEPYAETPGAPPLGRSSPSTRWTREFIQAVFRQVFAR